MRYGQLDLIFSWVLDPSGADSYHGDKTQPPSVRLDVSSDILGVVL